MSPRRNLGGDRLAPGDLAPVGFAYPEATGAQVAATARLHHRHVLRALGVTLAGFVALLVGVAVLVRPGPARSCVALTCGVHPPVGDPVSSGTRYVSTQTGFSVRYWGASKVTTSAEGLVLGFANANGVPPGVAGGTYQGELQFVGVPANGATAQQVVAQVIGQIAPGATRAYVVPGVTVGYRPGYGAAYDYYPNSGAGDTQRIRVVVLAAVRNGLAVVAVADGPYLDFAQPDVRALVYHPTIADVFSALLADSSVNSVLWPGEQAR